MKIITRQKEILRKIMKKELPETFKMEEITRNGKKKFKIILVNNLMVGELSGSLLRWRKKEPVAIRI